jgi:hypothetical protein
MTWRRFTKKSLIYPEGFRFRESHMFVTESRSTQRKEFLINKNTPVSVNSVVVRKNRCLPFDQ